MALLAPTPANTPLVPNLSEDGGLVSMVMDLPVVEEQNISEMVSGWFDGMDVESQKSVITRSLLLDFAEKTESVESSGTKEKTDDDNASVWSIQVNASTHGHDEDEETLQEMGDEYCEEEEEEEEDGLVDELCDGISKTSLREMFEGKHTRFAYNSDGEMEGEEECGAIEDHSTHIIRLKGLPTPKGKPSGGGGAVLTEFFSFILFGWLSYLTPSAYFIRVTNEVIQ